MDSSKISQILAEFWLHSDVENSKKKQKKSIYPIARQSDLSTLRRTRRGAAKRSRGGSEPHSSWRSPGRVPRAVPRAQYGFAQFDNPAETVPLCAARLSALLRRTAPRRVAASRLASLSAAFLLLDQERAWRCGPPMRRLAAAGGAAQA